MTQLEKNHPGGERKTKMKPSRSRHKAFNPDKLVSDIEQQTQALNMLIKKLDKQPTEEDFSKIQKTEAKSKSIKS